MRVRDKPMLLRLLSPRTAVTLFGTVYVPRELRERLAGTAAFDDLLDHEAIHVARQHARGMVRWHLCYALSRRFRWDEEKAAYHSSLKRLRDRGETLAPRQRDLFAARLSGPTYLFMTDRITARAFVDAVLGAGEDGAVPRGTVPRPPE